MAETTLTDRCTADGNGYTPGGSTASKNPPRGQTRQHCRRPMTQLLACSIIESNLLRQIQNKCQFFQLPIGVPLVRSLGCVLAGHGFDPYRPLVLIFLIERVYDKLYSS